MVDSEPQNQSSKRKRSQSSENALPVSVGIRWFQHPHIVRSAHSADGIRALASPGHNSR